MSTDSNSMDSPGRSPHDKPILVANWFYILFLGAIVSGILANAYDKLFPAEVRDLFGNAVPVVLVLLWGLAVSVGAATYSTIRLRRRANGLSGQLPWRRWAIWAAAAALFGAGLWGVMTAFVHARSDRMNADIVGTWHQLGSDGDPYSEVTFHPDKTFEYRPLTGPENERGKGRGVYEISPDGVSINLYYDPPIVPRRHPDGTPLWENAITFSDRDHLVIETWSWLHHARISYRRIR